MAIDLDEFANLFAGLMEKMLTDYPSDVKAHVEKLHVIVDKLADMFDLEDATPLKTAKRIVMARLYESMVNIVQGVAEHLRTEGDLPGSAEARQAADVLKQKAIQELLDDH